MLRSDLCDLVMHILFLKEQLMLQEQVIGVEKIDLWYLK